MNFYEITLAFLDQYAKTFDDIDWIGSKDFTISKENFRETSERINVPAQQPTTLPSQLQIE